MPDPKPLRLLFVCTGNICRSPMAAAFARDYARRRKWSCEIDSASAMGLDGHAADLTAQRVMQEVEIDMKDHRSKPLTPELMAWADYVLVMEVSHAARAREMAPGSDGKVLLLGQYGGVMEVPDPIGGWKSRYRKVRDLLQNCVGAFMDRLPPGSMMSTGG